MENKQRIWVDGLMFKRPSDQTKEKAPWVKGHVSIKVVNFLTWFQDHSEGQEWLNLDLKESQDKTKLYFELNTYKKPTNSDGSPTPDF